jgi:hypothetical protein
MTDSASADYQTEYETGKAAFERGDYRRSVSHLETAKSLVNPNSIAGGDIQIWLVTAYDAAGQREDAITLCRQLTTHPSGTTRKEAQRVLYILEAPKLKARPEWLTQIPDLDAIAEDSKPHYVNSVARAQPDEKPKFQVDLVDLSQVNTEENRFVWVALGAIGLIVGVLVWLQNG